MSREDHGTARRNLVELIDEYGAKSAQTFYDVAIVHNLVTNVDRRPKQLDGTLDDLDRAIDTSAKPSRIGK